jgi:hypothetical protein
LDVRLHRKGQIMPAGSKTLRTCKFGHSFYKSSDCSTCPKCEAERKVPGSFLHVLGAPARRALERINISTVLQLSCYTEIEILQLHGIGKGSLPKLHQALSENGLTFKSPKE